jgi:hypothetical protein
MFYQLMAAKYANRRTFSPETEGGAGAGTETAGSEAGAADGGAGDANANADGANDADAGQGGKSVADAAAAALNGKKPDDEKAQLLREVMDKKGKLKEAEDKLKAFEGIDPEKYRALLAKQTEDERKAAEEKGDFERVKQMMAEAHATETQQLKDQIAALNGQLNAKDGLVGELTVGSSFSSSAFIRDNMVLSPAKTRVLYGDHFDTVDGKVVAYDKPRGAPDRTPLVDASGAALSFDAALEAIVSKDPDKKSVLRSNAKPGAGSTTTPADTKTVKPAQDGLFGRARILASLKDA